MKKLLLLTGLVLMTSCHSDRFLAIDAILFDQQEQINALVNDLDVKASELQSNIDNLDENLNLFRDNLVAQIDELRIEVSEADEMILEALYAEIESTDGEIDDLQERIDVEVELLNSNIEMTAEEIAAIQNSIVALEGELDVALGELSIALTSTLASLQGEVLVTVASVLQEYLTTEYDQIVVEVNPTSNDVTNETSTSNTTSNTTSETTSSTVDIDGPADARTAQASTRQKLISINNTNIVVGVSVNEAGIILSDDGVLVFSFDIEEDETQREFQARINTWIDDNL